MFVLLLVIPEAMMKTSHRKIALMFIMIMVLTVCTPILNVFAASYPVELYVESYKSGKLVLYWNALPGTASVSVQYHYPDINGNPVIQSFVKNQAENRVTIDGLTDDIIYDIEIRIFDGEDAGGNEIGKGLLFFLPRITFYADVLPQERYQVAGGGFETGITPGFNMRWIMPRVYNGSSFVYADDALPYMEQRINGIYNDGRTLKALNFRINISTDIARLDSGSAQSSVSVVKNGSGYSAEVSGYGNTAKVKAKDSNGYLAFDLRGRKDFESPVPQQENEYQLIHPDVVPGTVYYMNIKPVFLDAQDKPVNALTVGAPDDHNGSKLSGPFAYAYTPIRFQLTKDNMNNIYVKIYKINQGSLDLPKLYYQVQSTDDSTIKGEWTVLKVLDDTYFGGNYAISVISGVSPNNEFFYKIVAKTDSRLDRLESPVMAYMLKEDTTRPPVPRDLAVAGRKLRSGTVINPETGQAMDIKSTDIILEWEKPENWESVKNNLYFHVLMNTNQFSSGNEASLYAGDTFLGSYPLKYRLAKYISAASPNIQVVENRLRWTINGMDLFTWEDENGTSHEIPNSEGYPDFLIPNTVYYIRMYTTDSINRGSTDPQVISDYSLTISFTTLPQIQQDVPLANNFKVYENTIDREGKNIIRLQFEGPGKNHINWDLYTSAPHADDNVYYDLYMSTRTSPGSFTKIGSTEDTDGGIFDIISGQDRLYITATVRDFMPGSRAYTAFGESIRPNTVYYFLIRTRFSMVNEDKDLESLPTSLLAVTTLRTGIKDPDDGPRRPLAPTDFSVAKDEQGNLKLTGTRAEFSWSRLENGVKYRIIAAGIPLDPETDIGIISDDPVYQSFVSYYGSKDSDGNDGVFILDPDKDLSQGFFEYNPAEGKLYLTLDGWLHPNRLYYFSIKAVDSNNESIWVTIPVTTKLIDMPEFLEAVNDYQIGFSFIYGNPYMDAANFRISVREHNKGGFTDLNRSQCSVVKSGSRYYVRIFNLKEDTPYDIRVYTYFDNSLVHSLDNVKTRNGKKEIEVKWVGSSSYEYQVSIRTERDDDYILLDSGDFEIYMEKSMRTSASDKYEIYALVKSCNGTPLMPNTKYYVRVRAVKRDPDTFSKYTNPVQCRTNFDQEDYDEKEDNLEKEVIFLDRIKSLESEPYWLVDRNYTEVCKILFKRDRLINDIKNSVSASYIIDLAILSGGPEEFMLYVPLDAAYELDKNRQSLVIKIDGAEFIFRPGWITGKNEAVKQAGDHKYTRDIYIVLKLDTEIPDSVILPAEAGKVSAAAGIEVSVSGISEGIGNLEKLIHNELYNEETGLVSEKLEYLLNLNIKPGSSVWDRYLESTIELLKTELSVYINSLINNLIIDKATITVKTFDNSVSVRFLKNRGEIIKPYALFAGDKKWTTSLVHTINDNTLNIDTVKPGRYIAAKTEELAGRLEGEYGKAVMRLSARYDLSKVFSNLSSSAFSQSKVTTVEMVLLYELVTGYEYKNMGMTPAQKAVQMGIDKWIKPSSAVEYLTRDRMAAVLAELFCAKAGINMNTLQVNTGIRILDADSIENRYFKPVMFMLDKGIVQEGYDRYYRPKETVTREELIIAMLKALELAGESI